MRQHHGQHPLQALAMLRFNVVAHAKEHSGEESAPHLGADPKHFREWRTQMGDVEMWQKKEQSVFW